ncbi:DUF5666 domain-containing protein, partial [Ideonella sp.]|uniref:DUF5666 domain-containing protein n=1 Tax=Ideonella sp. TaxID=1929293 RepID=UPI003BB5D795
VSSTTVFEASLAGGLNALTLDSVLEVHARWDAARSVYLATRVEPKTSASAYKVRGTLAALDTAGQTFRIGTALISYANATKLPALLADGQRVRVKLQTAAVNGRWLATEVKSAERKVEDHSEAEVQGLITAITSATSFSVDGLAVDASSATFRDGQAGIVLGARVEVSGAVVNGVLVATKVHLEDGSDDSHEAYELHGAISALDTTTMRFALRGLTVDYSAVAEWRSLSAAQLANGLKLEVKGALSADGTTVTATRISLED